MYTSNHMYDSPKMEMVKLLQSRILHIFYKKRSLIWNAILWTIED